MTLRIERQHLIGAIVALVIASVGIAAAWSYRTYREGQELHRAAQVAISVLFQAADKDFIITDATGAKRPATVAEVLVTVAKERVAAFREPSSAPAAGAPPKSPVK